MVGRYIGSVFILVGAAIGAGMLALPIIGAGAGFFISTIALIGIWFIMLVTSLLTLEVNLAFEPYKNSFGSMAKKTLGMPGYISVWIAYLMLLYATTAAYIAGSTSLLDLMLNSFGINLPAWCDSVCFTLFFGFFVFFSMRSVDYMIRGLLSVKGILIILTLTLLMPYIDYTKLMLNFSHSKYIWAALPIFLNAFGFHFVIPSVSIYCNQDARALRRIIITASLIPLIIYILWILVSMGIIPLYGYHSFNHIAEANSSVGGFVGSLSTLVHNKTIAVLINAFSNIAMTTSFLGVSLGLFDFLADGFKRTNNRFGRFQTAILTFMPPLAFAILYPNGFILALEYSTFFAIILEIFLPALMAYRLIRMDELHSDYHCFFNKPIFTITLVVFGVALMVIIILDRLHFLPMIF
jgi:tyrosine-specific transport protein